LKAAIAPIGTARPCGDGDRWLQPRVVHANLAVNLVNSQRQA